MLSKRSIRREFALLLSFFSLTTVLISSVTIYFYVKNELTISLKENLKQEALLFKNTFPRLEIGASNDDIQTQTLYFNDKAFFNIIPVHDTKESYRVIHKGGRTFMEIIIPYRPNASLLSLTKDVTDSLGIIDTVLKSLIVVNTVIFAVIAFVILQLTKRVSIYLKKLSSALTQVDEKILENIDVSSLPEELKPLGNSINSLFDKLKKYLTYQKELFIGIAHELKTPLAVMKLKNEVTLIKKRDAEKYIDTLKTNIESISEMDAMISSALSIGRQEGAVFEKVEHFDINKFLVKISENFTLLAKNENKTLLAEITGGEIFVSIQPTLLNQIVQNFLQNAIKFTPEGGTVHIKSSLEDNYVKIEVADEGKGIEGNIDIFAPFRRSGNKSGAGLGLFLAKNAAETMNAVIEIKNRSDGQSGALASVKIPI